MDQASRTTDEAGDMGCYAMVVGVVVAAAVFVEVHPPISVRTHSALKGSFWPDKHTRSVCNSDMSVSTKDTERIVIVHYAAEYLC